MTNPGSIPVLILLSLAGVAFGCASAGDSGSGGNTSATGSGVGGNGGASSTAAGGSSGSPGQAGTNGLITVSTGGSSGDSSGTDGSVALTADAACAAESRDSAVIVTDLFIMVDRSVSMGCGAADTACDNPKAPIVPPTRWTAVTDAIAAFLKAPTSTGIGAGLGFFGLNGADFCNVAAYATPAAPIAPLPGSAANIMSTIMMNSPGGTTPTVPALQGSINYATSYTMATPGHTAAVVFVTDGLPNGCLSTIPAAATVAQTAFTGTPSIKTYVVGMGFTMNLDTIALAGSGGLQHYFPAQGDVTTALSTALKQISQQVIKCDYSIPTMGQALDYGAVNVQTKIGMTGTPGLVGNVSDASMCTAAGGWYYDANPPAGKPSKITLCPQSCDPLTMADGSSLKVLIGCATVPAMVK